MTSIVSNEDFGVFHCPTQVMSVYVYSYAWNRDYTARVRFRRFSVGYDLETAESIPF